MQSKLLIFYVQVHKKVTVMNWFPKFMSVVILQSTKKTPVLEAVRIIKSDPKRCVLRLLCTFYQNEQQNQKLFYKINLFFPKIVTSQHSAIS